MCYFTFYFIILQNNRVINRMQKKIHLCLNKYIHTIKIKIRNAEKQKKKSEKNKKIEIFRK